MVLPGPPTHLQDRVTNHVVLVENIKNNKSYKTIFFVEVGGWEDQLGIRLTQQSWGFSVAWAELGKIPLSYI